MTNNESQKLTNKQLRAEISSALRTAFGNTCPSATEFLICELDRLIDSEESAWAQLEEMKASDIANHSNTIAVELGGMNLKSTVGET